MKFQGFIGPTYSLKSSNVEAQKCVNLFPEIIESGTGKNGEMAYLKSTPGLEKIINVGDGPIRCIHIDPTNNIFVVSGNKLYKVINSSGTWSAVQIGTNTFATSISKVRAASSIVGEYPNFDHAIVFVDGLKTYLYLRSGLSESFGEFALYGYVGVQNPTHVLYIDGYFVYASPVQNKIFVSDVNSLDVDPLNFASSEGDPDKIIGIISNNRELWISNTKSTELYINTGNPDFPFERISGGFIEKGCISGDSIAKIDGIVIWVGRDESGQGAVFAAKGLAPQRISNHAVEYALSISPTGDALQYCSAYTYHQDGHSFYVLNYNNQTWVFDFNTKLWHERSSYNSLTSSIGRHRAETHAFYQNQSIHLIGDYMNNKLYKFNDDYFTDDGIEITRVRSTPHISNEMKRIFCKSFQIDMEVGVGLATGLGSDPQVMLDFSDDGGHTWSSELWTSIGKSIGGIGEYKKRVIWRRLGNFRDRIFRIKITDPVKVTLISAELDLEMGAN